ncbi:MAG: asparagine synthase (glutamine-hydrolyzing), partial [Cyanobacteria bacterium 13_1_40CM_2_61_4]
MLAATSKWGLEEALKRFNGMFAFALWDRHERALHLVRDRLGEKPLYYGWIDDVCVFASELKAFHAYPGFRGEIDRDAVALYLRHNYVPAPLSIYRGVYKLPAATILSMTEKTVGSAPKPASYWSVREVAERGVADPMTGHENDIVAELHELLKDAVALRMEAEVPLGAFLSGGVDSSTVVALMQAQSRTPVRTFSIGFYEDDYNEAEDAKAVARRLGTEHTELYVTPDEAMAVIPHLPTLYDEPFADSSQIPTFLISQLARRDVTVALSGDGGDELFGGYDRYLWGRRIWGKIRWCPAPVRRTAGNLLTLLSPAVWDRGYSSAAALLPPRLRQRNPGEKVHKLAEILSAESADAMYLSLVSHSKEPTLLVPGSSEPTTTLTDRKEWAKLADFTQRMQYLDTVTYLPDDILVKLDRASMGVSLEARVPLLDHRVVEWAWRIPVSLKFHRRASKWLLRQVLYHYVSKDIIERPKMGFGVPIGKWLRGPLRHWAESLL